MNNKILTNLSGRRFIKHIGTALLIVFISSSLACQKTEEEMASNASPSPTATEKKRDDFEQSLASVQSGNFAFILAFRRADGEVFSSDDKKFIKANAPNDTNQWVLTGDGKCVIAGSNYKFTPEHLEALKKRFTIEDYSPQPVGGSNDQGNVNTNANDNTNVSKNTNVNTKVK